MASSTFIVFCTCKSMSDESSLGSPRMRTPDLKSKPGAGHLPWWSEEDNEDTDKKREATRQSWIKPKVSKPESKPQEVGARLI